MTENSLVSVIMSTYNEKLEWIKRSVNSILSQTYRNIEFIIIVDKPDRKDIIDYLEACKKKDSRIVLEINEKNLGLIKSLNKAIALSTGEYIARMDADDISHLGRLKKQLEYINEKKLDLIGSNINLVKEDGEVFSTTDKLLTHKYLKKLLAGGTIGIVHPTFFGRREVFVNLDGYKYSPHTEDKEFLARIFVNGYKVGNVKDVLLDCMYTSNSVTKKYAIYVGLMGQYVSKIFKKFMKTGIYNFDYTFYDKLKVYDRQIARYTKSQVLLGNARENLNKKFFFKFYLNMIKAFFFAPTYVISGIKINLFLKLYKILENKSGCS